MKFHEIRHTFAVRAIEIPEFDIKSLSEILGHKNVSFTLNVYGSANLQQKVKCMNLLNDLLLKIDGQDGILPFLLVSFCSLLYSAVRSCFVSVK